MAQAQPTTNDRPTTKLIVSPIDNNAKGSYRERKILLHAVATVNRPSSLADIAKQRMELDSVIERHLSTSDGTPLEDVLAELSADEFDGLYWTIMGGGTPVIEADEPAAPTPASETEKAAEAPQQPAPSRRRKRS